MRVKIKVRHSGVNQYKKLIHQHLRYSGIIQVSEECPKEVIDDIVIIIQVPKYVEYPKSWANNLINRIKSFGDHAEVIEE